MHTGDEIIEHTGDQSTLGMQILGAPVVLLWLKENLQLGMVVVK